MSFSPSNRRSRDRLQSAQQDNIDKQIMCLHRAMAKKLLANHEYIVQIQQTIETRYAHGKMRHGAYLFWTSLLEFVDQPELFKQTLLEDTPQLRKYRRQTPFVGILTEQERQAALDTLLD